MPKSERTRTGRSRMMGVQTRKGGGDGLERHSGEEFHPRTARLRGRLSDASVDESKDSWFDALEQVIQQSIRELTGNAKNVGTASGMRDLESVVFARCLRSVGVDWQRQNLRLPPELDLFSNPIAWVAFQVHERSYRCIKYGPASGSGGSSGEGYDDGFSQDHLNRYRAAIDSFSKKYSSRTTTLKDQPSSPELLAHLFDHLQEEIGADLIEMSDATATSEWEQAARIHKVHPARRSAIIDWQKRMEALYTEHYGHEEEGDSFYTYPIVDILVPDGLHLVLLLVSPLDENFVDEKVGPEHRCAEICLALYELGQAAYPVAIDTLVPHIRQSFARVLFSSMHKEASQALASSYEAHSAILRHWVSEASKGYQGMVGESNPGEPFNAWKFCQAIVQKILCARVPGVNAEVYPFDRVFILQETGTTARFDQEVPVEVLVLEASILSNNPADRNQYLTRRERRIRGTEDFECDAGRKVIEDDNRFRFFIHGDEKRLIFTPKQHLTEEERVGVRRGRSSSASRRGPEQFLYVINVPEQEDYTEISGVVRNLFGRLLPDNYGSKEITDPADQSITFVEYKGFTPEFERQRLAVTEKYDEDGVYYRYQHGISLAEEAPLFHQLQSAYFAYLDLKLREQDRKFRQEALSQENLTAETIADILKRHDSKRKLDRKLAAEGKETWTAPRRTGEKAAKVVWLSYSWALNDENTARILRDDGSSDDGDGTQGALLGDEYRYSMILVCDQDPEKSLSQLNAERDNLRLFYKLIMQRIWFDRLAERDFLESRSRMIGHSLAQFLHRAKGLVKEERSKEEIQGFYDNLRRLMEPQRVTVRQEEIGSFEGVFDRLLGGSAGTLADVDAIIARLQAQVERWFSGEIPKKRWPEIKVTTSSIPMLRIRWPVSVVSEAFNVMLKNACEAAAVDRVPNTQRVVRIQVHAVPHASQERRPLWFVDIVFENPGGPIPPTRLEKLSAKEPKELGQNKQKRSSFGVGVYLARYELQNQIGRGADLLFANLGGDIVQSRLRLPADLIEPSAPSTAIEDWNDLLPEVIEGDYVLYVEDSGSVYRDAIRSIQALLPPGVALEHRVGRDAALALARGRLPRAVFTDFTILKDEEGADSEAQKYGTGLLMGLMKIAKDQSVWPPIWVLTAESEEVVRQGLGEVSGSGYRFVAAAGSTPKQLARPGTIAVFSEKQPADVPQFAAFLQELFASEPSHRTPSSRSSRRTEPSPAPVLHAVSIPLEAIGSGEFATTYHELYETSGPGVLIVRSVCKALGPLERALSEWFAHPGLPDPDAVEPQPEALYRLTEHVWHRGLVLALLLDEKLFRQLPMQWLYWALSKNLWIETSQSDNHELATTWRLLRNEDRGPLSLLRHDLRNQWSGADLETMLRSVTEKINICEKAVQLSDKDRQSLDGLATRGSGAKVHLEEYLRRTGVVASDRAGFHRSLQELDAMLTAVPGKHPELQQHLMEQRLMIQALDDYLGGS